MKNKYLALLESMLYIECYYNTDINARELAKTADMPLNKFNYLFKSLFEFTPNQFITRCRLRNACIYLITTERSFLYIAASCGFKNASQFSKSFKRVYNMTPTEFRYRQRGNYVV